MEELTSQRMGYLLPACLALIMLWLTWQALSVSHIAPDQIVHFCMLGFASISMSVLIAFPRLVSRRSMSVILALLMVTRIVEVSPVGVTPKTLEDKFLGYQADALAFCLVLSPGAGAVWVAFFHCSAAFTLAFREQSSLHDESPDTDKVQGIAFAGCLLSLVLHMLSRSVRRAVQGEVELSAGHRRCAANTAILTHVWDAVAEMDEELRLREPSPSLSRLLVVDPPESMLGQSLRRHMSEQDWAEFSEQLRQVQQRRRDAEESGQGGGAAGGAALRLSMQVSAANRVDVEAFCVASNAWDGSDTYLLGLRSSSANAAGPDRALQDPPPVVVQAAPDELAAGPPSIAAHAAPDELAVVPNCTDDLAELPRGSRGSRGPRAQPPPLHFRTLAESPPASGETPASSQRASQVPTAMSSRAPDHTSDAFSSGASSLPPDSNAENGVNGMAVWFDTRAPDLDVVSCDSAYRMFAWPTEASQKLMRWVHAHQRQGFAAWVEHVIETSPGELELTTQDEVADVYFRFGHMRKLGMWIRATIRMEFPIGANELPREFRGSSSSVAKLIFNEVQFVQGGAYVLGSGPCDDDEDEDMIGEHPEILHL